MCFSGLRFARLLRIVQFFQGLYSLPFAILFSGAFMYTTNAVESLNYTLQRNLKQRHSFPNDEAAMKLIFMVLRRVSKKWTMPIRNWGQAMHQFSVIYGGRLPL